MKVSVSLPEEDVRFLDAYADTHGYPSRSAAVHQAVANLRASQLAGAYEDAWRAWADADDAQTWDAVAGDGLAS